MLHFLIKWRLFQSILNLFEYINEDRLATEWSFQFVYYFEERCLEHPEVNPDAVVQIPLLDCFHLKLKSRYLGSAAADLAEFHDIMYIKKPEERPNDVLLTVGFNFVALRIQGARG